MKRIILSVFAAAVTAAWAIPASAGDVTFSGQYRVRGEYKENYDLDDANRDTVDTWTQRVRLTANAKATDDVSAKITLQDTRIWGAEGNTAAGGPQLTDLGTTVNSGVDVHEAYLNVSNIFGTPVSLRAGRQELAYGDERLVGAINWSNNGQAFDALKLAYATDALSLDVFTATINEDNEVVGGEIFNDDVYLNGIYATLKQVIPNNTLDVYLFHQTDNIDLARYTLGARLKGAAAGVDYTVEVPFQFGTDAADNDISAYAFAVKAGYTLPTPMKIRVGAEVDYATGDDTSTGDTENQAFNNLFPTNHDKFGIADAAGIGWTNIMAWTVNAGVDVNEKLRLFAAYWDFTLAEDNGGSDDMGSEFDLIATYKYNNNVTIEAGAARYMVGDNGTDDADTAYLMITGNF